MFLQTTAGDNRGPPQQSYFLGSILLMKNEFKKCKKYVQKKRKIGKNTPKKLHTMIQNYFGKT